MNAGIEQRLEYVASGEAVPREDRCRRLWVAQCVAQSFGCCLLRRALEHGKRSEPGLLHRVVVAFEARLERINMIIEPGKSDALMTMRRNQMLNGACRSGAVFDDCAAKAAILQRPVYGNDVAETLELREG